MKTRTQVGRGLARRIQHGFTLLEVIVALGIMSAVLVGVSTLVGGRVADTRAQVAAEYLKSVGTAADEYIKANYSAVAAIATATSPALIRVSDLVAGGFLQGGYSATDPYGQSTCVLALQPQPGNVVALVATEGGEAVDDLSLGQVAATIGAAGGAVYAMAPATMRGAMGGWSTPPGSFADANNLGQNCAGGAGAVQFTPGHPVVALWFANNGGSRSTLYRDAMPSDPSLNTMNTPILMGAGAVVTPGAACTTVGAIARDGSGDVMSCANGSWQSGSAGLNWKGTVSTVANLPATGNAPGDTWRVAGFDGHAFTWDAAHAVWQGLTLAPDGSFHLPGVIYANASSSSYGALSVYGSKNGYGGVNFKDSAGNNMGTLMMNSNYSGFYNTADNSWRFLVDNAGNATVPGSLGVGGNEWVNGSEWVNGNASVANNTYSGSLTVGGGGSVMYGRNQISTNDWAVTAYGGGWWNNSQPESAVGSIYANDIYLRSTGQWESQRGTHINCYSENIGGVNASWWYPDLSDLSYMTAIGWCAPGYTVAGFNTSGRDGAQLWGGWTGDSWPWIFCCAIT